MWGKIIYDGTVKRKVRKGFTQGTRSSRFEVFFLCELCEKSLRLCVKKALSKKKASSKRPTPFLFNNYDFLFTNAFPSVSRYCSTDERSNNEYPQLFQCRAACENSRSYTTCRVYRCSCQWNTYDVNENE